MRARERLPAGLLHAMLIAAVLGCAACGAHGRHRFGSTAPAIPLATASPATVRPAVVIAGIIAPYQNVSISSALSEPTDSVSVVEGDRVRRGQVLAVLDTTDLRASYTSAERSATSYDARAAQTDYQAELNIGQGNDQVKNAQAAVYQAQQTLTNDQKNLTRYQSLLSSGYVSQQQVDQQVTMVRNDEQGLLSARATLQSALTNQKVNGTVAQGLQAANVQSARADAQSAHAQAAQIASQIQKALITSPVDGVVVNRNLNPGEYPGSRTIFTVQQLDPVYAELNASSQDVFRIRRGAQVILAIAGVPGVTYHGKVDAVLGQVQPGSTNFTVQAILANPGYHLKAGMAVTGTVSLPAVSGTGIPSTAFLDDAHDSIMLVQASGVAQQQAVKELGTDGKTSIVTGIANGTQIVSDGQLGITSGQNVLHPPEAGGAPGQGSAGASGRRRRRSSPSASPSP